MYQPQFFPLGNFGQNMLNMQNNVSPQQQPVKVDFSQFNIDHFFTEIQNIDYLSEPDIIALIKNHIDVIVERTLADDIKMGPILSHPKFVDAFCKAITTIPITPDRKTFCNKLSYEYTFADVRDDAILDKFRNISAYINQDQINKLMNLGLARKIAINLTICRYSSIKESTNVKRLNFMICLHNADIMTEQMCVWIYEQLFDHISELFISSMLEIYTNEELDSNGVDFRDVYGNISLAILTILNNMPLSDIRKVIEAYIERFMKWYSKKKELPRFTLTCLSNDYARIVQIVDMLTAEGIYVP